MVFVWRLAALGRSLLPTSYELWCINYYLQADLVVRMLSFEVILQSPARAEDSLAHGAGEPLAPSMVGDVITQACKALEDLSAVLEEGSGRG